MFEVEFVRLVGVTERDVVKDDRSVGYHTDSILLFGDVALFIENLFDSLNRGAADREHHHHHAEHHQAHQDL